MRILVQSATQVSESVLSCYHISTFPSDSESRRCALCFYVLWLSCCVVLQAGHEGASISWSAAVQFRGPSSAAACLQYNDDRPSVPTLGFPRSGQWRKGLLAEFGAPPRGDSGQDSHNNSRLSCYAQSLMENLNRA